ncbi:MAG: ABC transporter permease subunit [Bacteroidales bacterium]|nr:ABC transporter permease subunit [Bacteroidales bacterium]
MFRKIVNFEIRYRLKQPATYICFVLLFGISFIFAAIPDISFSDTDDTLLRNAPVVINKLMLVIMIFGSVICAAVMGVSFFRDYNNKFYDIISSLPVTKKNYLWGKFTGSFIVVTLIFTGIVFGMMLGYIMPWREKELLGPFHPSSYFNPFIYFIVPNLFILGSIFFITGSFFRSKTVVYLQGVIFLIIYLVSGMLIYGRGQNELHSLFDPLGLESISEMTGPWSVTEKNSALIDLKGITLYNRIIWLVTSGLAIILFNWLFDPAKTRSVTSFKQWIFKNAIYKKLISLSFGFSAANNNLKNRLPEWQHFTNFNFRIIARSTPFLILIVCVIGLIVMTRINNTMLYSSDSLPVMNKLFYTFRGILIFFLQ